MHQRKLGPFTVSAIGLGCMNLSMGYGKADGKLTIRLLNECIDVGYSFLDTASMYGMGHNEELIGKNLSHRRDEYVLASKCGIVKNSSGGTKLDGRADVIRQTCEDSLRRLQTDVIGLYYLQPRPESSDRGKRGCAFQISERGKNKNHWLVRNVRRNNPPGTCGASNYCDAV